MGVHRINGRFVGRLAGLTAAYVVVARLGLMVDPVNGFATLVWPSTGLALAALLLQGSSLWPGVWLGAFAVNCWAGAPWRPTAPPRPEPGGSRLSRSWSRPVPR